MAKAGRPKTQIDWKEFDKLCALHCTQIEIAEWFGCTDETIQNIVKETWGEDFSAYFKRKASRGKMSLRRKQIEKAMEGSVPLLIWMGKQLLGQKDSQGLELTGKDGGPIETKKSFTSVEELEAEMKERGIPAIEEKI